MPLFERLQRRFDIEFFFSRFAQTSAFLFDPHRVAALRARPLAPPPWPVLPTRWRVVNKLSFWTHIVLLSAQLAVRLRRARPDVLVGGDFERFECVVACLAARHLGRPFVLWSDTWHWPVSARRRMRRPLVRWMVKRADVLVAGGSKAAAKLVELGGAGKPLVNVYHTNVTARPLDRRPERFVLYVGRLEDRKGVEYLLDAFAGVRRRHPDLRLRILGRGERLAAPKRTPGFNPSGYDYIIHIIHALGQERRREYVQRFVAGRPEFVNMMRRTYTSYEQWLEMSHWSWYQWVLLNYDYRASTPFSHIWGHRRDWKDPASLGWLDEVTNPQNELQLTKLPEDLPDGSFVTVQVEYKILNTLGFLPIVSRMSRYFVAAYDSANTIPVSLPPYEQQWEFPVVTKQGQSPPRLYFYTGSVLPGVHLQVTAVRYRVLPLDDSARRAIADLPLVK